MLTGRFLNVSLLGREVLQGVAHVAVLKTACFNPFEVREVLQARCLIHCSVLVSLNPFEVREVSQACAIFSAAVACCLNPFEVREVLQDDVLLWSSRCQVSIPLKSGRCCKARRFLKPLIAWSLNPFEVREVLQGLQRTLRFALLCLNPFEVREVLQGIAYATASAKFVSIPLKSGRCCKILEECNYQMPQSQSL